MCKVSFIVPVYNGEKTIERCIKSLLNQEENDINYEIIVVNDGSNDKTKDILEKYSNEIKIVNKKNGGLSDARNVGMKEAKGEYFIFVENELLFFF